MQVQTEALRNFEQIFTCKDYCEDYFVFAKTINRFNIETGKQRNGKSLRAKRKQHSSIEEEKKTTTRNKQYTKTTLVIAYVSRSSCGRLQRRIENDGK